MGTDVMEAPQAGHHHTRSSARWRSSPHRAGAVMQTFPSLLGPRQVDPTLSSLSLSLPLPVVFSQLYS